MEIVLAVNGDPPGGDHWRMYQPAILVAFETSGEDGPQGVVTALLDRAASQNIRLVFLLTSGGARRPAERGEYSGSRGGSCVVLIDDAELAQLLEKRGDVNAFLRARVLQARLRGIQGAGG